MTPIMTLTPDQLRQQFEDLPAERKRELLAAICGRNQPSGLPAENHWRTLSQLAEELRALSSLPAALHDAESALRDAERHLAPTFTVTQEADGGCVAVSRQPDIVTQADTLDQLLGNVREAMVGWHQHCSCPPQFNLTFTTQPKP